MSSLVNHLSASVPTSSWAKVSTFFLIAKLLWWKPFPFIAMLGFFSKKKKASYFLFQNARCNISGEINLLSRVIFVVERINLLSLN